MNLVVFGATGPSGRLTVGQALAQSHAVAAFARKPADLPTRHEKLSAVKGDVLDQGPRD